MLRLTISGSDNLDQRGHDEGHGGQQGHSVEPHHSVGTEHTSHKKQTKMGWRRNDMVRSGE